MNDSAHLLTFLFGIVIGMLLLSITLNLTDRTYRDGQMSVVTGEVRYELMPNPDGTTTWKKVK